MSRIIDIRLVRTRDDEWRASSPDASVDVWPVDGCRGCPFDFAGVSCVLDPDITVSRSGERPPANCPLRIGPMAIALAEGA